MNLVQIEVEKLLPSPENIRSGSSQEKLAELTESIRAKGVQVPLIARPQDGTGQYEVVAGNRRLEAAIRAELSAVPVIVVESMTDEEMREVMLIENLQREDLHPLDAAVGFARLHETLTVAQIAERIGKSRTEVARTIQLTHLCDKGRNALEVDEITVGQALLIAPLEEGMQLQALEYVRDQFPSAVELRRYIEGTLMLALGSVDFPKDECQLCPARTGNDLDLFGDSVAEDRCTRVLCFTAKAQEHVRKQVADLGLDGLPLPVSTSQWGTRMPGIFALFTKPVQHGYTIGSTAYRKVRKTDLCDATEPAVAIDGKARGKVFLICRNAKCKQHWKPETKDAEPNDPGQKRAAEAREKSKAAKIENKVRATIFQRVLRESALDPAVAGPDLTMSLLRLIGDSFEVQIWSDAWKEAGAALGLDVKQGRWGNGIDFADLTDAEVMRTLVAFAVARSVKVSPNYARAPESDYLERLVELLAFDANAVRSEVLSQLTTKRRKSKVATEGDEANADSATTTKKTRATKGAAAGGKAKGKRKGAKNGK